MDGVSNAGVNAAAGDGEAQAAVAVDEIQGEFRPVPQMFRVGEFCSVRAEVLQKVVACAGGDYRHGGVGKPGDAVGRLVDGAVPAAGVDAHRLPGLCQGAGEDLRSAGAVRQQAPAVQIVGRGQTVRQGADAGSLVLLPGMGVDQKDMAHDRPPLAKYEIRVKR